MNFIQKIQKVFHIDKWWGRCLFLLSFYLLFWFVFYFILFFISWGVSEFLGGWFFVLYLFSIFIFSSIWVTKLIICVLNIKKFFVYLIHFFSIIISLSLTVSIMLLNLNFGSF